jgi:hypothetical protein
MNQPIERYSEKPKERTLVRDDFQTSRPVTAAPAQIEESPIPEEIDLEIAAPMTDTNEHRRIGNSTMRVRMEAWRRMLFRTDGFRLTFPMNSTGGRA